MQATGQQNLAVHGPCFEDRLIDQTDNPVVSWLAVRKLPVASACVNQGQLMVFPDPEGKMSSCYPDLHEIKH